MRKLRQTLTSRLETEHNFALSILKELGDMARDVLDLRKRIERLEKRHGKNESRTHCRKR